MGQVILLKNIDNECTGEIKVYRLNKFIVNRANKQYNHLDHDFEINLINDSIVKQIQSDLYINVDVLFKTTKISSISLDDSGKCFGR